MPLVGYERVQAALPQTDVRTVASYLLQLMLRNVATDTFVFIDPQTVNNRQPRRSRAGCILASPSYAGNLELIDQDYVFHWTRDAAVTAFEMASWPMFLNPGTNVSQQLCDYVSFSKLCQDEALANGCFFRASFLVDGTVRPWSDQKDGAALQNLALIASMPRLDPPSRTVATAIAQENLNQIVANWRNDANMFGPWEDVTGPSFFARSAQLRCLQEAHSANALNLNLPADLGKAVDGLSQALEGHWDPVKGYYISVPGGVPGPGSITNMTGFDPNTDVIMACIYGSISCTDPKLLATAAKVRELYDVGGPSAYPINQDDRTRGFGPLIGRYPSDVYDGDFQADKQNPIRDHPWALCTANFAELYYRLAKIFDDGNAVDYDSLTGPFFDQIGVKAATVNNPAQRASVVQRLRDAGEKMLQAIIYHSDHYELSEQFDANTGYEKSVSNLTWSYAAYLSAVRAR